MTATKRRAAKSRSLAEENWLCQFHYAVSALGKVYWFPTEKDAQAWIGSHKTEGATHYLAKHGDAALAQAVKEGKVAK